MVHIKKKKKKSLKTKWTYLVVQCSGVCLPVRGTQIRSLIPEDPIEQRSPWAVTTEPACSNSESLGA